MTDKFDQAEFDEMVKKGTKAWEGVDVAEFIEGLRGDRQPHDPHVIDRSAMGVHATPEMRYENRRYSVVLQQRWKWDDGTCAGWRDVPVVAGD